MYMLYNQKPVDLRYCYLNSGFKAVVIALSSVRVINAMYTETHDTYWCQVAQSKESAISDLSPSPYLSFKQFR